MGFLVLATCPISDWPSRKWLGAVMSARRPYPAMRRKIVPSLESPAMKNVPCCAPTSGISSSMISSATVAMSRCPCIRPEIRARLVLSQYCSWLALVVSRRDCTIALMLSLSSATSPSASTEMDRVRSPVATALVTWEMARTWRVRFPASSLTFSVSRFHVPDSPSTSACPPSRPLLPTSRATRVTSAANEDSWSTMVLMVVLSSRISPRASTSIFFDRSPWATAVVTSAMLRTWLVRLPAMKFTESVRSRHVPPTPGTWAWPPRLPSVPTSRATRVTSSANADSWSTMVFRVSFRASISPLTSTVIFWLRSPRATAVATWAMSRTCPVRLSAMALTDSVRSFQVPATPGTWAWPPSLPSVPTSRATRVTSEVNRASWSVMLLKTAAISSISGSPVCGRRVLKSPPRTAVRPSSSRCSRGSAGWLLASIGSAMTTPPAGGRGAERGQPLCVCDRPILPLSLTCSKTGVKDSLSPVT